METTIYFVIFASIAIVCGFLTITRSHPLSAALSLVVTMIALAGLYALLAADFLFVIQILVYAGAIMALIIFVIMLLNLKNSEIPQEGHIKKRVLVTLALLTPLFLLVQTAIQRQFANIPFQPVPEGFGGIKPVGLLLYQTYFIPFEIIAVLLLVALVGVVALAKRRA